jgi:hypothetical protein
MPFGVGFGIDVAYDNGACDAMVQTSMQTYFMPTQLETDYAVDYPYFHRPSLRIRNHDVHREPLIFSGFSKKRTGA